MSANHTQLHKANTEIRKLKQANRYWIARTKAAENVLHQHANGTIASHAKAMKDWNEIKEIKIIDYKK